VVLALEIGIAIEVGGGSVVVALADGRVTDPEDIGVSAMDDGGGGATAAATRAGAAAEGRVGGPTRSGAAALIP
jgi:hypothetical protein